LEVNEKSILKGTLEVTGNTTVSGETNLAKTTIKGKVGNEDSILIVGNGKSELNGNLDVSGETNLAKTTIKGEDSNQGSILIV